MRRSEKRRLDRGAPLQKVKNWDVENYIRFGQALFRYAIGEAKKVNDPLSEEEALQAAKNIDKTEGKKMKTFLDKIMDKGRLEGIQEGIQRGRQEGIQEGIQKGIQKGRLVERRSNITDWLIEDYGPDANGLVETINTISDFGVLKSILRLMPLGSLDEIKREVDKILQNA